MMARSVRVNHVVQVIDRILGRQARRTANMALSSMRQMFRHGLGRGFVELDPTFTLSKKHAGGTAPPVERNLTVDEITELATKMPAAGLPERFRAAVWLLLATGARVGELSKSKRHEFDSGKKTWQIPAQNSKNGRAHLVHLSSFALKQLKTLEKLAEGEFVLAGRVPGTHVDNRTISKAIRDRIRAKPLSGRKPRAAILLLSGGEWSVHDLRRTFASRVGDLGIAPHIIERCLNHAQAGIVKVYQQQEYLAERKAAFDKWGAKLSKLTKIRRQATTSKASKPRVA